jgi:predicted phage tail protein
MRSCKSRKDTQHNDQKKRENKRTNYNLQNTTQKTKNQAHRIPIITGGERMCSGRVGSSCSTSGNRRVNLVTNPGISHA